MRHALFVAVGLVAVGAETSGAADWTDAIFPVKSHDFGTVARGSKVRHSFKLINSTQQDIHIESWKAKCGCTDVRVGARDIPPGTQTVIEAVIDTTRYTGFKPSGLTLFLDRPTPAQVDLNLTCFIRADLTLNPGQVDFGVVNRSTSPKRELTLNYTGAQADWAVEKMGTISDHIVAELKEIGRSPGGQANYQLTATLKPSAPIGFFKDEITLTTNDPSAPKVPISVSAVVQSNVTVSPAVINLGNVKPGQTIQKTILVRSSRPFKLEAVRPGRPELAAASPPDQARPMHSVNVTFKAPATPGPFHAPIDFESDLKDEPPARVMTFATVVP